MIQDSTDVYSRSVTLSTSTRALTGTTEKFTAWMRGKIDHVAASPGRKSRRVLVMAVRREWPSRSGISGRNRINQIGAASNWSVSKCAATPLMLVDGMMCSR